jgi:hypothetical protein
LITPSLSRPLGDVRLELVRGSDPKRPKQWLAKISIPWRGAGGRYLPIRAQENAYSQEVALMEE